MHTHTHTHTERMKFWSPNNNHVISLVNYIGKTSLALSEQNKLVPLSKYENFIVDI